MRLNQHPIIPPWLAALAACATAASLFAAPAAEERQYPGITEPLQDVTVSCTVPGTVEKLMVKEGDLVEKGQPLVDLHKKLEELEVRRRKVIAEDKSELTAAAAHKDILKIDYDGTLKLFETTKSVSKEQLLKKELEYKQALGEHGRLAATSERQQIEYEMALVELERRQVKAPLAGTVTEFYRKAGEDCKAQEPLLRVVETRKGYFITNIDASAAAGLKVGQQVELEINAGAERVPVAGTIYFISPVIDSASGLLKVKATFENPNNRIRPGAAGTMRLPKANP